MQVKTHPLHEMCPNTEFLSGPYFPVFGLNTGKYGPEKTPNLDTFDAVIRRKVILPFWLIRDKLYRCLF